ncbi:MAG TPA: hypothetical protein VK658_06270 [Chryseolinea sp.]|nr:hypothetical protein [Chryseolinea sp.]
MRPIFTFYRPFAAIATFFTLFTGYLLLSWGSAYYMLALLWIKAFSNALLGVAFHLSRAEQLHFYHNLGYSTVRLYALAMTLDLLIWLAFIVVTLQFL